MRATFFIATSYIHDRQLYWWERIATLLRRRRKAGTLTYPTTIEIDAHAITRRAAVSTTSSRTRRSLDLDRFLDELAVALGVDWSREIEARTRTS